MQPHSPSHTHTHTDQKSITGFLLSDSFLDQSHILWISETVHGHGILQETICLGSGLVPQQIWVELVDGSLAKETLECICHSFAQRLQVVAAFQEEDAAPTWSPDDKMSDRL